MVLVQSFAMLMRFLQKWSFDKSGMTVLSHSNGTVRHYYAFCLVAVLISSSQMVHGWLLKAHPELFTRSCFVDPVCFCMSLSSYNRFLVTE